MSSILPSQNYLPDRHPHWRTLRALGVVGEIFAILGLLLLPFALLPFSAGRWYGLRSDSLSLSHAGAWWLLAATLIGMALSLLLLVGSIGVVWWRRWARPVMLLYAIMSLTLGLGGAYFFLRWAFGLGGREHLLYYGVGPLIAACGWFLGLIYAAFALYFMTRRDVRERFRHAHTYRANI